MAGLRPLTAFYCFAVLLAWDRNPQLEPVVLHRGKGYKASSSADPVLMRNLLGKSDPTEEFLSRNFDCLRNAQQRFNGYDFFSAFNFAKILRIQIHSLR